MQKAQKHTPSRNAQGYSLFEFAMVIPPLLLLIMGAVDITRLVQSYRALGEGVETTLRCLYPAAGECTQLTHTPSTKRYNWYTHTTPPPRWAYKFMYEASMKNILRPTYRIDEFHATVLDKVTVDVEAFDHYAQRNWYAATGIAPTVIMSAVKPTANIATPGSVSFDYKNTSGNEYGSKQSFNRNIRLSINGEETDSKSTKITIRHPGRTAQNAECYLSKSVNLKRRNHEADLNKPCPGNYSESGDVVIWVKGTASGTDTDSTAVVELNIGKDLGGREYTGPGDASLVPRGSGNNFTTGAVYSESGTYHTLHLKYDEDIELDFTLRRSDDPSKSREGTAKWSLNEIVVFTPEFVKGEDKEVDCIGGVLKSRIGDTEACTTQNNEVVKSWQITNADSPIRSDKVRQLTRTATNTRGGISFCSLIKATYSVQDDRCVDYSFTTDSPKAMTQQLEQSCQHNYGVPTSRNKSMLKTACGIDTKALVAEEVGAARIVSEQWSEKDITISDVDPVTWSPGNCDDLTVPGNRIPQKVTQYKQYTIGEAELDSSAGDKNLIPVLLEDDTQFRKENNYLCSEFQDGPTTVFNKSNEELKGNSFFKGSHLDLGCNYVEMVRDIAISEGMPANGYIDVVRHSPIPEKLSFEPAADSCIYYWYSDTDKIGEGKLVAGSPFVAEVIPEICQPESGVFCTSELESIQHSDEAEFSLRTDAAQDLGIREMQVSYPQAQLGCKGANCVEINVAEIDNDGYINVDATMQVPVSLFMGKEVTLSYQNKERWEGFFTGASRTKN